MALFSCACGAIAVDYDLKQESPAGWETAEDGTLLCPACAAEDPATSS